MWLKSCSTAILLFSIAFLFFGYHLGVIPHLYFDELHYIPAANQWLHMVPISNLEHPLVGKFIMAFFIHVFGDNFFGWRLGSVIFASLSIVYLYKIAKVYFKDHFSVISVTVLSLFNFWFFIQARIAMIEIYMVSFFLMAWYYQLVFQESKKDNSFYLSAFFWGLAIATKWSIILFFIPSVLLLYYRNKDIKKMFVFLSICLGVYYLSFIPYLFVSTDSRLSWYQIFLEMPLKMLELQKSVGGFHIYESKWYTWPLMIRPIWYEFKKIEPQQLFQGVMMLGNPMIMYVGLLSVVGLFASWKRNHDRRIKELLFVFCLSYFLWSVIPRKMTYFYYFFPSAVLYSLMIPAVLKFYFQDKTYKVLLSLVVIISVVMFLYFYPVLSGVVIDLSEKDKWSWFHSWI